MVLPGAGVFSLRTSVDTGAQQELRCRATAWNRERETGWRLCSACTAAAVGGAREAAVEETEVQLQAERGVADAKCGEVRVRPAQLLPELRRWRCCLVSSGGHGLCVARTPGF